MIIPRSVSILKLKDMLHLNERTTRSRPSILQQGFIDDESIPYIAPCCGINKSKSSPKAVPINADIKSTSRIYRTFIRKILSLLLIFVKRIVKYPLII